MKTVLIVDSVEVSRQFTEMVLSNMFATICAATGIDALEIFREVRPDVVLSKFRLSDMTGVQLLRKLQAQFGEKIPFVLTDIDNGTDTERDALQGGAWDFVRIPFAPEILICRLEKVLELADKINAP
ncbi:MAG: response regulator [Selenomonadaceae bacterium]|nr:response regulator [Selenomonadaceae bacterium]